MCIECESFFINHRFLSLKENDLGKLDPMIQCKDRPVLNFSAGPAKLPDDVILKAQLEFKEYRKTGMSVLEMSHRSADFDAIIKSTEKLFRDLMSIPPDYSVLFMQGGGSGQFAAIPLNLMGHSKANPPEADYIVTGAWSEKSAEEAKKYLSVNSVLQPTLESFNTIPAQESWKQSTNAAYLYYCSNETIHGVEFPHIPEATFGVPIVADMSSNILSKEIDVSKHGLIFAGTQKNIGSAGLTLVIVRNDLLGKAHPFCPSVLDYSVINKAHSLYNTPPTYNIYLTKLVLEWIRDLGGVDAMKERNEQKAKLLYDVINESDGFYNCPVIEPYRSKMNIPFRIGSACGIESLEKEFLDKASKKGMKSLKGHRSVGGVRASLYNAITLEETQKLVNFMKFFHEVHLFET